MLALFSMSFKPLPLEVKVPSIKQTKSNVPSIPSQGFPCTKLEELALADSLGHSWSGRFFVVVACLRFLVCQGRTEENYSGHFYFKVLAYQGSKRKIRSRLPSLRNVYLHHSGTQVSRRAEDLPKDPFKPDSLGMTFWCIFIKLSLLAYVCAHVNSMLEDL